jgi:Cof subfamily protein (haloacid dehalogenase superfamily)
VNSIKYVTLKKLVRENGASRVKQKLIAIDLDGTTLNTESQISKRTFDVLTRATKAGHYVTIATGRPFRMSDQFYRQLDLRTPMVNFNGGLVHKPRQVWANETEYSVSREIAFELMAQKENLNLDFIAAENRETFFIDQLDGFDQRFFSSDSVTEQNLLKNMTSDPTSLLVKTQNEFAETAALRISNQFNDTVDVRTWGGPHAILEIVPKGVHKALGLSVISNYLKIDPQDIIAFGDEHNDLEMLEYAGWGVAMANGTDQLKAVANDVTDKTNAEDGLADYLENLLAL